MPGNKNYKKTFILNIIGGLLIIAIAFYIMFFKKEELSAKAYNASLIVLFIIGPVTVISNILLLIFISKNIDKF